MLPSQLQSPLTTLLVVIFALGLASADSKSKRQIYREQVLPSSGGKIPEGAFRADRLALNRLNKEGISVPDGILLDHRHVHAHPHEVKHDPEDEDSVIKIIQTSDHRYTPPEGTYHHGSPPTVSSTYLIRKPIGREETNIRTPDQQMPLHQYLAQKQHQHFPFQRPRYGPPNYQPPPPIVYHPPPVLYNPPPRHQGPYYPIPVPLELPNKEISKEELYPEQHEDHGYGYGQGDIHDDIDWPYLLGRYTQLADDINNGLVPQDSYHYSVPQSLFYSPQVLPDYDLWYPSRFPRKSAEGGTQNQKGDTAVKTSTISKRLYRVKCRTEDGTSKCRVRT